MSLFDREVFDGAKREALGRNLRGFGNHHCIEGIKHEGFEIPTGGIKAFQILNFYGEPPPLGRDHNES